MDIKQILLILSVGIVLSGCDFGPQRSGVEIMSNPAAKVYIDGKDAGMTPYKNNSLKPGILPIRLVSPSGDEWSKELRLENFADTVVNWNFGDNRGGYVLNLEKTGSQKAGLLVNGKPDSAAVSIDGEIKGFSPLRIEDVGEGDRQISLSYPGYKSETIFAKGILGYQLVIDAELTIEPTSPSPPSTTSTSATATTSLETVIITSTETGWLRVHQTSALSSAEVAKVNPGETYPVLSKEGEMIQIKLNETESGWVSLKYTQTIPSVSP